MKEKIDPNEVVLLFKNGLTLQAIGKEYGVSRQRIWQIIKYNESLLEGYINLRAKKTSKDIIISDSERYVYEKSLRLKYIVKLMPFHFPYDIEINGYKVEIKYRSNTATDKNGIGRYYFKSLEEKRITDFHIFVCGNLRRPAVHIVPSHLVKSHISFPIIYGNKTKFSSYLNNWEALNKNGFDKLNNLS